MSKFLSFEDRLTIEKGLCENRSFGTIAKEIRNDRTSLYEAFSFYYGEEVLQKPGCHQIPADDIILRPALLKK